MRINVYSQELTEEVIAVSKRSNTGIEYKAVQFVLHSSPMLHHPPADDDRSAVTFWLPQSERGLREFHGALAKAYMLVGDLLNAVPKRGIEECKHLHTSPGAGYNRWCDDCGGMLPESVPQKGDE